MLRYAQNATIAKARAMWGKRLLDSDYSRLVNCRDVSEAAEYLKENTHFGEVLSGMDISSLHRDFLEALLKKHNYIRFTRLSEFIKPDDGTFNENYAQRAEISEIFSFLRHMNAGAAEKYISSMPSYLVGKTSYDIISMAKARSRDELIDVLKDTPYAKIIASCATNQDGNPDYTLCEVALRTYYYRFLTERVKTLHGGREKTELLHQIEIQIDLINIINAYRLKKFFNADAETIKRNMFPFSGRISLKKQYEMLKANSEEEFLLMLDRTIYGKQLSRLEGEYFEMRLSKLRFASARSAFLEARSAYVCLYCVQYLFTVELENVIKIIEGIRYNKPASEISALLVV